MANSRRTLKRNYRRYIRQTMGYNPRGLFDRNHARYMGYLVPMSFREWVAARCP